MEQREIRNIVLLVHPLYSALHGDRYERKITPIQRKNVSFLLGLWGNELKAAARDPHTLVIVIPTYKSVLQKLNKYVLQPKPHYFKKFDKFIGFAKRALGDRLVLLEDLEIRPIINKIIQDRGFKINGRSLAPLKVSPYPEVVGYHS